MERKIKLIQLELINVLLRLMGPVVVLVDFSLTKKIKLLFQRSITLFTEMLLGLSTMTLTITSAVVALWNTDIHQLYFSTFSKQFEHMTIPLTHTEHVVRIG